MNDEKIPEGFYINSHKSLQEHILWMGVPRDFFILNGTIGCAIGIMLQIYPFLLITVVLHLISKKLTKEDPLFFKAMLRHIKQPRYYEAR